MTESLTAHVYEVVIRRILLGEYRPGQALNRRELAKSLGVSISPVNEAFAVLQVEGIVTTVPRKGTFIATLDRRDLVELTVVRAAIEAEAARHYCGRRISAVRNRIIDLAERVDEAEPLTFDHLHADITFHRTLVSLAGNRALLAMLDTVITRSLVLVMEATMHADPGESLSHREFVEALCEAAPHSAADLARANVFSGKEAILSHASGGPHTGHSDAAETDTRLDVILSTLAEEQE